MRRLALAVPALAAAWSATLLAQGVSGTLPPVTPPPGAAKPAAYQKVVDGKPAADFQLPSAVDPRVCLEFPTNAQIIACAERYRPHRRRA